ncbi:MAG TPA: TonB-dependent receptor [Vicinamibacterales bacterium]|nr:TonB-dependent receptor [Vicinamibacterales bacterium]
MHRPALRRAIRVAWLLVAAVIQAISASAQPAAAQAPLTLHQEVIITASVAPTSFNALTRTVFTVTREELDRFGISSIVQGLRLLPSVDARARGPRDVQTDFSVRGATFGQALVLVDGWRLNDSQSGHHNGDLPITVSDLDRIEVLAGAGSAVHGADALGGTIQLISRRDAFTRVHAEFGEHEFLAIEAATSGRGLPAGWSVTGWANRSDGFTFDRDFAQGGAALRGPLRPGLVFDVRHLRKAFGANGFYGASPSKEWTDLTLAAMAWTGAAGAWTPSLRGEYRNHGDHFRWDIARPGFAENRHRTDAVDVRAAADRPLGRTGRLTVGASAGGDWIDSSNLGDREYAHGSGFTEVLWTPTARATAQAGLRVDHYSSFGTAWNPSISAGTWLNDAVRVRGSVAHGFRIPTYTELYYRDPAHAAQDDLEPERGWSADAGIDWSTQGWLLSASPYRRWDQDVIDWVKAQPADLWQTTNVRDVTTTGIEVSGTRRWRSLWLRGYVTHQDVDAPALTLLSKYVLEYVRTSAGVSLATPVVGSLHAAANVDYRRRLDRDPYTLVDLRLSYALRRTAVFVEATNLFDAEYVEIPGVAMPGRWITAGVTLR